jgi:integrase
VLRAHRTRQIEERLRVGSAWTDNGLVFTDEVGGLLDGVAVTRTSFYSLLRRAGLPQMRFHDLRRTAATLLPEAGVSPLTVAQRLGHATPALVMNTYGHVTPRMQEQATAVLDAILHA